MQVTANPPSDKNSVMERQVQANERPSAPSSQTKPVKVEDTVLAKGAEFNYITDYPQDLYILYNDTGKTEPMITYDWFPKKAKELGSKYNLPVFPEDYAYYLLSDNETLILISGIKSIRSNFKFNIKKNELQKLPEDNNYKLYISSLLKSCGYKDINSTYKCSFYKPLISENLIN